MGGNANGLEDAGGGPGKSYLFLLTAGKSVGWFLITFTACPGIGLPGEGAETLGKHVGLPRVRCATDGP